MQLDRVQLVNQEQTNRQGPGLRISIPSAIQAGCNKIGIKNVLISETGVSLIKIAMESFNG